MTMYPGDPQARAISSPAVVMTGSGAALSWTELDEKSTQLANYWRQLGLTVGDHVACLLDNSLEVPIVYWAAERSGLYFTPINSHLTAGEVAFILENCTARSLITNERLWSVAKEALSKAPPVPSVLVVSATSNDVLDFHATLNGQSSQPLEADIAGGAMVYSSGTTGTPKGVIRPLSGLQPGEFFGMSMALKMAFGTERTIRYLSTAPMYHSAPIDFAMGIHRLGGTLFIMERFDAEEALRAIEHYRITHSQWVPTMFSRLLRLDEATRLSYDVSSLEYAIHGAAPCPIPLKRAMIEWFGPIIWEYYAGTDGGGSTTVSSPEWLARPGTVGRMLGGTLHICDDEGDELPVGQSGTIYFDNPNARPFHYFGDEAKTASSRSTQGWTTMGDVGYLDDEGYLFLTDRKAFTIISGGVNVYPQEAENVLAMHPDVADVAVFGIPHSDLGEVPHAVIQLVPSAIASEQLSTALLSYCREQLATIKCPRTLEFIEEMPRLPTGKLYKQRLKDRHWPPSS